MMVACPRMPQNARARPAHRRVAPCALSQERTGRAAETIHRGSVATPLGEVHAAVSAAGVVATSLPGETLERFVARLRELAPEWRSRRGNALLRDVLTQLREFFVGKRTRFDLPIDLRATPFTRRVLDALAQVPCGETRTYGSLAKSIGAPGAAARRRHRALQESDSHHSSLPPGGRHELDRRLRGKARAIDVKRALLELEA